MKSCFFSFLTCSSSQLSALSFLPTLCSPISPCNIPLSRLFLVPIYLLYFYVLTYFVFPTPSHLHRVHDMTSPHDSPINAIFSHYSISVNFMSQAESAEVSSSIWSVPKMVGGVEYVNTCTQELFIMY